MPELRLVVEHVYVLVEDQAERSLEIPHNRHARKRVDNMENEMQPGHEKRAERTRHSQAVRPEQIAVRSKKILHSP